MIIAILQIREQFLVAYVKLYLNYFNLHFKIRYPIQN